MNTKICQTHKVEIFISGNIDSIKSNCLAFCDSGFCVSVFPCDFVYTGGTESGACVVLINYPRFPHVVASDIDKKAFELAEFLLKSLHQRSCTVKTPKRSYYIENNFIRIQR